MRRLSSVATPMVAALTFVALMLGVLAAPALAVAAPASRPATGAPVTVQRSGRAAPEVVAVKKKRKKKSKKKAAATTAVAGDTLVTLAEATTILGAGTALDGGSCTNQTRPAAQGGASTSSCTYRGPNGFVEVDVNSSPLKSVQPTKAGFELQRKSAQGTAVTGIGDGAFVFGNGAQLDFYRGATSVQLTVALKPPNQATTEQVARTAVSRL